MYFFHSLFTVQMRDIKYKISGKTRKEPYFHNFFLILQNLSY